MQETTNNLMPEIEGVKLAREVLLEDLPSAEKVNSMQRAACAEKGSVGSSKALRLSACCQLTDHAVDIILFGK